MTAINISAPSAVHAAIDYLHRTLRDDAPPPRSLTAPVFHIHGTTPLARALLDRLAMRAIADSAPGPLVPVHIDELIRYRGGRNALNWSIRRALAAIRL